MFASRRILNVGLGLGLAGAVMASYTAFGPPASAKAATTTTTTVARGSVLSSVSATGNASASTQLAVTFGASGIVSEIDVQAGSTSAPGRYWPS